MGEEGTKRISTIRPSKKKDQPGTMILIRKVLREGGPPTYLVWASKEKEVPPKTERKRKGPLETVGTEAERRKEFH